MKKQLFLLSLLGLFLTGCSINDSITDNEGENSSESVARNYLSISMVSANSAETRATKDNEEKYEDGTEIENAVNAVRFFFFDEDGEPTPARKRNGTDGYDSFIDWYPTAGDESLPSGEDKNNTVEKVLTATLGINVPTGTNNPSQVLAVLNPTPEILGLGTKITVIEEDQAEGTKLVGPSLTELQQHIQNFKNDLTESNFVMSNSVYLDSEKKYTTELKESNFVKTIEETKDNKVTIYVERVLARLDLTISMEAKNGNIYKVANVKIENEAAETDEEEGGSEQTGKDIYVKFLGWNITGTPVKSRLIKEISADWTDDTLFGANNFRWNTSAYHRSFWAINPELTQPNPPSEDGDYLFGNLGTGEKTDSKNENSANALPIPSTVYLQENANAFVTDGQAVAPEYPTKVIIAAQLVNENGEPIDLVEWAYKKYTPEGLKTTLVGTVLNNLYKATDNGKKRIEASDLEFKTAKQIGSTFDSERYYVYVVLSEDAEKQTWTIGNAQDAPEVSTTQVNQYIRDAVNHAKVWNNGYTYYYFDIQHLGAKETPGYCGVVRNHVYKADITSVQGLGTPVYDPDEVIYPEKPEDDESIVSAEVKILQWRIVSQGYDLKW